MNKRHAFSQKKERVVPPKGIFSTRNTVDILSKSPMVKTSTQVEIPDTSRSANVSRYINSVEADMQDDEIEIKKGTNKKDFQQIDIPPQKILYAENDANNRKEQDALSSPSASSPNSDTDQANQVLALKKKESHEDNVFQGDDSQQIKQGNDCVLKQEVVIVEEPCSFMFEAMGQSSRRDLFDSSINRLGFSELERYQALFGCSVHCPGVVFEYEELCVPDPLVAYEDDNEYEKVNKDFDTAAKEHAKQVSTVQVTAPEKISEPHPVVDAVNKAEEYAENREDLGFKAEKSDVVATANDQVTSEPGVLYDNIVSTDSCHYEIDRKESSKEGPAQSREKDKSKSPRSDGNRSSKRKSIVYPKGFDECLEEGRMKRQLREEEARKKQELEQSSEPTFKPTITEKGIRVRDSVSYKAFSDLASTWVQQKQNRLEEKAKRLEHEKAEEITKNTFRNKKSDEMLRRRSRKLSAVIGKRVTPIDRLTTLDEQSREAKKKELAEKYTPSFQPVLETRGTNATLSDGAPPQDVEAFYSRVMENRRRSETKLELYRQSEAEQAGRSKISPEGIHSMLSRMEEYEQKRQRKIESIRAQKREQELQLMASASPRINASSSELAARSRQREAFRKQRELNMNYSLPSESPPSTMRKSKKTNFSNFEHRQRLNQQRHAHKMDSLILEKADHELAECTFKPTLAPNSVRRVHVSDSGAGDATTNRISLSPIAYDNSEIRSRSAALVVSSRNSTVMIESKPEESFHVWGACEDLEELEGALREWWELEKSAEML